MDSELKKLQADIDALRVRLAERAARLDELIKEGRGLLAESSPRLCGSSISWDEDWQEYRVRFFDSDGRHYEPADYYTDCRDDAVATSREVLGAN